MEPFVKYGQDIVKGVGCTKHDVLVLNQLESASLACVWLAEAAAYIGSSCLLIGKCRHGGSDSVADGA